MTVPPWEDGPISNTAPIMRARYFMVLKPIPWLFLRLASNPLPLSSTASVTVLSDRVKLMVIPLAPP